MFNEVLVGTKMSCLATCSEILQGLCGIKGKIPQAVGWFVLF